MKNENINRVARVSVMAVLLLLTVSITKAQGVGNNPSLSNNPLANLSVNPQKAAELRTALKNPTQRVKEIQLNTELSPKQKQQQMEALQIKRHRAMDSLLTPEQKKTFLQGAAAARQASYSYSATSNPGTNQ